MLLCTYKEEIKFDFTFFNAPLGLLGVEPVAALIIRSKDATQIEIGLMPLLLNVIEPIVICLPNIDLSVWDRGPIGCQYGSFHQHGIAFLVEANVVSKLKFRDVGQMKWTEDR